MLGELHTRSCEPGTSACFVFYFQVEGEQTVRIATSSRLQSAVTVGSPILGFLVCFGWTSGAICGLGFSPPAQRRVAMLS